MAATVLLVDDHPIFRKGLRLLFEDEKDLKVIGEAADGQMALDMIRQQSPDVVVMDITMPNLNGIEATSQIAAEFPETKVIALSIHSEKQFVEDMLKAGASGYILKESVPEDLVKGIRAVMAGQSYLSPSITSVVISQYKEILDHGLSGQSNYTEILKTKLYTPPLPDDHIHRQELIDRLVTGQTLPLTIISTPAGYGKSVLVSCWLHSCNLPSTWVSIDKSDNDLRQFLGYFLSAIKAIFPAALTKSMSLLDSVKLPQIQVLAGHLKNDLAMIEQDFILVLDDFHLINEKSVHDLLAEILHHPPNNFHLVLIGRKDPFLPISSLRARGQLAELRLQDLRFKVEETQQYLQGMFNEKIDAASAASWTKITEGWITGLRLAALSMHHMEDFDFLSDEMQGDAQYVMEYLFNEVLTHQPPYIRECLLKISVVDRFCGDLCSVLCGVETESEHFKNGWEFVSLLIKENMFIIKLDRGNHWFRFHHLFQELLEKQLVRRYSSDEIKALHARASSWFAENNFIEEAIQQTLDAGDDAGAVQLIENNRHAALNQDKWFVVGKWLAKIPDDLIQQSPELLLTKAWVLNHQFRLMEIPEKIQQVESIINKKKISKALLGELNFFKAFLMFWEGKFDTSLEMSRKAQDQVPKQEKYDLIRGDNEIYYGMALQMTGKKDIAIQELKEKIECYPKSKGMYLTRLVSTPCFVHLLSGNLKQADSSAFQLRNVSNKSGLAYADSWSDYMQACCSFHAYDLHKAKLLFSAALEQKYIMHALQAASSFVGLAMAYAGLGNQRDAESIMDQLMEFVIETNDQNGLVIAQSARVRLSVLQGKPYTGKEWVNSFNEKLHFSSFFVWLENPHVTHSRALIAMGTADSLKEACKRLETLLEAVTAIHNTFHKIDLLVLQGLALYKLSRIQESLEIMEEALRLAEPGGWVRPFVELGKPMEEMLKQLQVKKSDRDFIEQLLAAFILREQETQVVASPAQPVSELLVEPLTNRELEILNLLAQNLYNKEIGERLYISTETVKTHLKGIYQKLEAGNRREAVAKARTIGLLSNS